MLGVFLSQTDLVQLALCFFGATEVGLDTAIIKDLRVDPLGENSMSVWIPL
jgi:hypothetical protein